MKINLTKLEADALWSTAGQMTDEMDYYNFMPRAKFKKFCAAYESGMEKLKEIIDHKPNTQVKP